jgi:hypothetical protein
MLSCLAFSLQSAYKVFSLTDVRGVVAPSPWPPPHPLTIRRDGARGRHELLPPVPPRGPPVLGDGARAGTLGDSGEHRH